jgi:hypothetical protein
VHQTIIDWLKQVYVTIYVLVDIIIINLVMFALLAILLVKHVMEDWKLIVCLVQIRMVFIKINALLIALMAMEILIISVWLVLQIV